MRQATRTMIVMDAGASRFQFRAGALIRTKGHILIHRAVGDRGWCLPGGRVEMRESSAETLAREIEEEIGCAATIGELRFVIENFFELGGRTTHEIGFYFDATLLKPLPFKEDGIVHRVMDGDVELEFCWVLPTISRLDEFQLVPRPLRRLLGDGQTGFAHLVHRDS